MCAAVVAHYGGGGIGGVGPIRISRKGKSGRKGSKRLVPTTETNMTTNTLAGHPSLSYFPGTFAHPGLLAPAFTPRPPDDDNTPVATTSSATAFSSSNPCLSSTVCPQQTQTERRPTTDMGRSHYIPSRILSPIPTMRRSHHPHPILSPLPRPSSPPRSRIRTTSPLAPESHHRQRPNRPRFPRSKIEPSLLRVAVMTQLIKRCKASDEYETVSLKGGAGGIVIMQKLSRSQPNSAHNPKYADHHLPAAAMSGVLSG